MQYVSLQLASRDGRVDEVADVIRRSAGEDWRAARGERRNRVELFSVFSGALAVHESLQMDTMLGDRRPKESPFGKEPTEKAKETEKESAKKATADARAAVRIDSLTGPTIKSHPWATMLGGRKPEVAALSKMIPSDQYFVQCRSLTSLLELLDFGDLWASHWFNQATQDATSSDVGARLRQQLAVRADPLTRPFYDLVVEQVGITGSDLFVREGSDVTLIFRLKQPELFKARLDGFLKEAEEEHEGAKRTTGKFAGVDYVHVASPDRVVHAFSAYLDDPGNPKVKLHIRSNSRVGLERVLATIKREKHAGESITPLGDTDEFKYIRTLMTEGAKEEDAFVYMSDPFIRHMVGPQLKLTESRRLKTYNHLRMIGHASLMFITERGQKAKSLEELISARCTPGTFGQGRLANPLGGKYTLSADGLTGQCSVAGTPLRMTPTCEIALEEVTAEEAEDYRQFLAEYNQYWRTFFDPIAIRIQMTENKYRVETIVLPLIDNSIYTGLARALGGKVEPLDTLPVPKGNIFSLGMSLDKRQLLKEVDFFDLRRDLERDLARDLGLPPGMKIPDVNRLLTEGLGNQIGLHIYDAQQLIDFNFSQFLGESLGSFNGGFGGGDMLWISMLLASINSPVYVSLPLQDTKVVDEFLDQLDPLLAVISRKPQRWVFWENQFDSYQLEKTKAGTKVRAFGLQFGPLKWRFFWGRIGDGLYIASKKHILDDLEEAVARAPKKGSSAEAVAGPTGHAMVRIRPQNWNKVLPDFQLGWAENNRRACLNNLGPLSNVARAYAAFNPKQVRDEPAKAAEDILAVAEQMYGVKFLTLDGGKYVLAADGKSMEHSLYGTALAPRQPAALREGGDAAQLIRDFAGATAELKFLEDGLHAVLTIQKK
jgi:hypothetical protein